MIPKTHTLSTQGESVNLPKSWQQLQFSQCIDKISIKHKVKQKEYLDSGNYPIIDQSQSFISGYCNDEIAIKITKPVIVFGDHTRCFKFVDFDFVAGADGIHILEPKDFFNEKLFYYFCLALDFPNKGYSRHYQYLAKTTMKIPPLEIQRRIAKRLDDAFSRIESGTKHLKSAKDNLIKYKQSLLKSAFNGTLTNDSLNGESANLPQGWTIKTLSEIAKIKGGKRLPKDTKYAETITPYPYVRVTDFENMSVNTTNLKYLTKETQQKIKNYTISKDDVYISIAGSIGKVGTIPDELDNANLTENAAKIVHSMDKKYLAFYLNSAEVQSQIAFSTKATTQPKLALYRIENLKVKIPPLETQKQIVAILEKHFTSADKVSAYIDSCLSKAKQLKLSLLKSAFDGKLD